jgi:hypothetical protein
MRKLIVRTALVAGATLAVAACNRHPTVNNITTNDMDANMTMTAPANDASAIESVSNNVQPTTSADNSSTSNTTRDTGAGTSTNNVESNTVGM